VLKISSSCGDLGEESPKISENLYSYDFIWVLVKHWTIPLLMQSVAALTVADSCG